MALTGQPVILQSADDGRPLRLRCRTRTGTFAGVLTAIMLTALALVITIFSWHIVLGHDFGVTTGTQMYLGIFSATVALATFGADSRHTYFDAAARTVTLRHRRCGVPTGAARMICFSDIETVTVETMDVGSFLLLKEKANPEPLPIAEGAQADMLAYAGRVRQMLAAGTGGAVRR